MTLVAGPGAILGSSEAPTPAIGLPAPPSPMTGLAHVQAPPPGHSGGFGEPTCQTCHAEFPLNEPGGGLHLEGLPSAFEPGREYSLTVILEVPETARAGFQLTSRNPQGEQAGGWRTPSGRVATTDSAGVVYAHSSGEGTRPNTPDRAAWTVTWVAPSSESVQFNLAANSANGDDSPFGDLVYATQVRLDRAR